MNKEKCFVDIEDITILEKLKEALYENVEFMRKENKTFYETLINIYLKRIQAIENILKANNEKDKKIEELGKGQHTLMQSRRKWKNRYYKERQKNKK